jgi:hypothetical protein
MGGGGARIALFCVLISLKRRVRANQLFKRDSVTRFLTSGFLMNHFPLSIPLGPFQIYSNIRGDIHSSRCTTGVVDTGGKWEKIFNHKSFNYFVWKPLGSRVNL